MGGGGKETPRQKMIGMMYLVLTALLAMNVSKDVLQAFVTMENGLNATNVNFDKKNKILYDTFEAEMKNDPKRTKPLKDRAEKIKKASKELCAYMDKMKANVYFEVEKGNGLTEKQADTFQLNNCTSKDNYDIPTNLFIGEAANPKKDKYSGYGLKQEIIKFKKLVLSELAAVEKGLENQIKIGLVTDDILDHHAGMKVSWEVYLFDHTTVAAAAALLSGVKNEVKTAESDAVNMMLSKINAVAVRVDVVEAKVVAPSSYVLAGDKYSADIFIAAYSSTQNPEIVVNGAPIKVESGMGKYEVSTSAEGLKEYKGEIRVKDSNGEIKAYPFEGDYMVAKPAMAVSPTKMNVFYIGVENPVDITVAGASPTDVVATLSGGGGKIVNKGQGHYIVTVTSGPKCDVNVAIKTKDGKTKSMGKMEFRVKRVPSPLASYAGITGDGSATKGELAAAGGVIPKLDDFVFDLKFPVISWVLSMNVNGVFVEEKASGASKTANMATLIEKARPGAKILIEQVQVKAPDGIRKVPGCVIKVK